MDTHMISTTEMCLVASEMTAWEARETNYFDSPRISISWVTSALDHHAFGFPAWRSRFKSSFRSVLLEQLALSGRSGSLSFHVNDSSSSRLQIRLDD